MVLFSDLIKVVTYQVSNSDLLAGCCGKWKIFTHNSTCAQRLTLRQDFIRIVQPLFVLARHTDVEFLNAVYM